MNRHLSVYCTILLSALMSCLGVVNKAFAVPPAYHLTDLGTLGGTGSAGLAINASGQVTGSSDTTGDAESHAFVWTPTTPNGTTGTMKDLGTLGGTQSQGVSINASGQVTGISLTTGDAAYHAFLYDGTMHDLGTSGLRSSEGNGINDSGHVTGVSATGSLFHAFLYDGTMHDLLGQGSSGRGINASGQVTGFIGNDSFLWTPTTPNGNTGTSVLLGYLNELGFYTSANAINASGQVTGEAGTVGVSLHAFLYDGTMHDLGTLGGETYSSGYAINDRGQITGQATLPGGTATAFLYTSETGMVDLNTLIDPASGWRLEIGRGINDAGQITGYGYVGNELHGFLLTPVPEPTSLVLLALALPFLAWRCSRRCRTGGIRHARRYALATLDGRGTSP